MIPTVIARQRANTLSSRRLCNSLGECSATNDVPCSQSLAAEHHSSLALTAIETNYLRVSEFTWPVLSLRKMYRIRRASRGTSFVRWPGPPDRSPNPVGGLQLPLVEMIVAFDRDRQRFRHNWPRFHRAMHFERGRYRHFLTVYCGRNCA
jgi:hypothetical protein